MTTLYLGTDDGVILTHNGQTGFAQAGHGLGGRRVRSLAGFPGRPDVAYAGVEGEGLYLTEDAGESWELLVEGDVHSLAIRHAAPGLLQGQEPVIYTGLAPPAVLVSTDRGRSWRECLLEVSRPAEEEGSEPAVRCLALHPQLSQVLWAGVKGEGVLRTADHGHSWHPRSEGLDPDVHDLLVHSGNPDLLVAATGEGAYRTEDGGQVWQRAVEGMAYTYTLSVAHLPGSPELLFTAGARGDPSSWVGMYGAEAILYHSSDLGLSWQRTDPEQTRGLPATFVGMVTSLRVHPAWPDVLYCALTSGTVYATADRGESWRRILSDLPPIHSLHVAGL